MATPRRAGRRVWRFRLNDTTLEVSAKQPARERQVRRRGRLTLILGVLAAFAAFAAVAYADDVSNNLDVNVDATAETLNLTFPGPNGAVGLYVQPTGGDGKPGCNLTGSTTLVVSVASSNTAVVTVTPSSITFTSCGDTPTITVTLQSVGSATVSISQASNSTTGTFNLAPATFSVNVTAPAPSDTTAPTAAPAQSPLANANGWNNGDVLVAWNWTDNAGGSGIDAAACTTSSTSSGEGEIALNATCKDLAGNTGNASYSVKVDKTAPTASASASPTANLNGWNKTDVTVSFSGSDTLSGVDSCDADVLLSSEGAGQSASGTCTDKAGNVSAPATASGINIDKTQPTVSLVGGPADDGTYYFGFVPAPPTCNGSDLLSGLDGICLVSGYSNAVGSHTVTATANDQAGNTNSDSHSYTVLAWTLNGFYQPVDMGGVFNAVKGGSTVPLKFEVFAGATELTEVGYIKSLRSGGVACNATAPVDDIETSATGGTSLRYDTTAGQFIYNWQTPKQAGKCYSVTMTTQDGSSLSAYFRLK